MAKACTHGLMEVTMKDSSPMGSLKATVCTSLQIYRKLTLDSSKMQTWKAMALKCGKMGKCTQASLKREGSMARVA
jgi:hypothetical protein